MSIFSALRKHTFLPWLLGGLLLGLSLAILAILGGVFTRASGPMIQRATPLITILAAPSATVTAMPSDTPQTPPEPPTATPVSSSLEQISPGQYIEIFGTGGDNLRLRAEPGLDATIAFLGVESEVFEVLEGPEQVDGYLWWFLRNPYNIEKTGWAASVYLRPISSP